MVAPSGMVQDQLALDCAVGNGEISGGPTTAPTGTDGSGAFLSEVMASSGGSDVTWPWSGWVELFNPSPAAASLDGWGLVVTEPGAATTPATNTTASGGLAAPQQVPGVAVRSAWQFPAGAAVPAQGFLLVLTSACADCSSYASADNSSSSSAAAAAAAAPQQLLQRVLLEGQALPGAAAAAGMQALLAPLVLPRKAGSTVALTWLAPAPQPTAAAVSPSTLTLPVQFKNVSFGIPGAGGPQHGTHATYLASPTPGAVNSEAVRTAGPFVMKVTDSIWPRPVAGVSGDLQINVTVVQNMDPVASVTLVTRTNFGPEVNRPFTLIGKSPSGAEVGGASPY